MNGKKAKLLRKIAKLSGRTDNYIKNEFRKMDKPLQVGYLSYMREYVNRVLETQKGARV